MNRFSLSPNKLKWNLIILFIIWIFAIASIFYVTQKPIFPQDIPGLFEGESTPFVFSGAALGRTLLDLGAAIWIWIIALGLGMWVYDGLIADKQKSTPYSTLEMIVFSLALGFGMLALVILALGLMGFINTSIFYGLSIILTLVGSPKFVKNIIRPFDSTSIRSALPSRLMGVYLILAIGMALSVALLPPTDWDGLFYHLTGPKLHLDRGQISPGIDIPHLNFPGMFEMLFMLAMGMRGDVSAKLMHFGFSLLLAGLVYLIAKRHLGLKDGWLAVLFCFSMPMVFTLGTWAYNDLALAFYQVAALYSLLSWYELVSNSSSQAETSSSQAIQLSWLIVSGVCCGLAMSLKYTSAIAPVTVGCLLLWWHWQKQIPWSQTVKSALAFGLAAVLIASPWYLKNWVFTGNPVYPFVFDGLFWDEFRAAAYASAKSGIGFNPLDLLALPLTLTLGIYDANYLDGRTGPLFLIFLPPLLLYGLFRYRRDVMPPAMDGLLIFALAQFAFWTAGVMWSSNLWQSRLLLPGLVPLCAVLAWIVKDMGHLNHRHFSLRRFLMLFIGAVMVLGLVDQMFNNQINSKSGWIYYHPLTHLLGTESRSDYLTRRLGAHYVVMEKINAELPPDAVITFLWEPRSYYCNRDCRPDSILDEYTHLQYLHQQDAAAINQAWQAKGVTHILVFRQGLDFLLSEERQSDKANTPDPSTLTELEATYLEEVFDVLGWYQVYEIKNAE